MTLLKLLKLIYMPNLNLMTGAFISQMPSLWLVMEVNPVPFTTLIKPIIAVAIAVSIVSIIKCLVFEGNIKGALFRLAFGIIMALALKLL